MDDEEYLEQVKPLANVLKMMNQPETLLFELIEVLCESQSDEDLIAADADIIKLNCGRHEEGHFLDFSNFQMIEAAESMLGTTLQEVTLLHLQNEDGQPISPTDQFDAWYTNFLLQRIIRQKKHGLRCLRILSPWLVQLTIGHL